MSTARNILLVGASATATVLGYWISPSQETPAPLLAKEDIAPPSIETTPTTDHYTIPSFDFEDPFDARKELNLALSLESGAERYGRLIAIGTQAARENPEQNLALLSPEIWDYPNYDLRGAFHAEWMRSDPETFLAFAEKKYEALIQSNQTELFPSYHLAYMEPMGLLDLLPKIQGQSLKNRICSDLLATLVELDPALLWQHRQEIATAEAIVDEATRKGLYDLALQFWERSEWQEMRFDSELYVYMAKNQPMEYIAHLQGYPKTCFATYYAQERPADAALWVRQQDTLEDFEYSFNTEHAAFFAKLFSTEDFSKWVDAPAWISEGIEADHNAQNTNAIFSAIKASPEACHLMQLKESFAGYLSEIENIEQIKDLYLALDNDHPILPTLEQFMLHSANDFSDAIVARTTREPPTPTRLMQVLGLGNLDSWPAAYFSAARDTLNSLSDDELTWSLSPSMLISLNEIAPERIQTIISTADPTWLSNTLNSASFTMAATLSNLDQITELVQDLPPEDAQRIIESARATVLGQSYLDENKLGYLKLAHTHSEILTVANSISIDSYESSPDLQTAIENSPDREDIYLSIANNAILMANTEISDPNIKRALDRIETGRELSKQNRTELVSTIQSLPSSERLATAKAILMATNQSPANNAPDTIVNLPFWSPAEREQLETLSFRYLVNYDLYDDPNFIW